MAIAGCGGGSPAVSPAPGSTTAAAGTQISFRGLTPGDLGKVVAIGSRSGVHTGALRRWAAVRGTSFLPATPFAPGEHVTVRTRVGAGGGVAFGFSIARVPTLPGLEATTPFVEAPPRHAQRFESRPDLRPPRVTVRQSSPAAAAGDIFLTTGTDEEGPMIIDGQGRLVWFQPVVGGVQAADLRVQRYRSRPVLTWWQGTVLNGHGRGEYEVLDTSYRRVAGVRAGNGYRADLHEFELTPAGTALITAYTPIERDLSAVGGTRHGVVLDSIVQEVDVHTGLVVFEWHALDHVGLDEAHFPAPKSPAGVFDYFHVNSVEVDGDGNLLLSARNTDAVYKIDRHTGAVIWRLGGRHSSFAMGSAERFALQHDVRRQSDGSLTLFDDEAAPKVRYQSRGLRLRIEGGRARLVRQYEHHRALSSANQGNLQMLPNGDALVGWGNQPWVTEFDRGGVSLFDLRLAPGAQSYRAYRFPWSATPLEPPAIAVAAGGGRATAYASWNGATDVSAWQLVAGPDPGRLRPVTVHASTGFETAIALPAPGPYVAVRALGADGRPLARSRTLRYG